MKTLVCAFAYNENEKIKKVIQSTLYAKLHTKYQWDFLVADDGSTDESLDQIPKGVLILKNNKRSGIGNMMKKVFQYVIDNKYDAIICMAGNYKDLPSEIDRLIEKAEEGYDFVQGSRYMKGGLYAGMPISRIIATKWIHPLLCSFVSGKRLTESTNGFRLIKTNVLLDKRIDWKQSWLNQYQLEPYVLIKAIQLGYKHTEVPVSKLYPTKTTTKMTGFQPYWDMVEAPICLMLGVRK